jgi:hypothetical protein
MRFTVERTILNYVSSEMDKHEKTCFDNQHTIVSFAFDTFDLLALKINYEPSKTSSNDHTQQYVE